MTSGVNFQPGSQDPYGTNTQRQSGGQPSGVQEAIKVLSLRLPKVLGARAVSPQALLSSPGSGGNPRVDSVVNTVLSRMFPTGAPPSAPSAPMVPSEPGGLAGYRNAPNVFQPPQGAPRPPSRATQARPPWTPPPNFDPRVIVELPAVGGPPRWPGGSGGQPEWGQPPSTIDTLPPNIDDLIRGIQGTFGGGGGGSYDRDPYAF